MRTGKAVAALACLLLVVLAIILHTVMCDWVWVLSFDLEPDNAIWVAGGFGSDRRVLVPSGGNTRSMSVLLGIILPVALVMGAALCGVVAIAKGRSREPSPE